MLTQERAHLSFESLITQVFTSAVATHRETLPLGVAGIAIPIAGFDLFLGWRALEATTAISKADLSQPRPYLGILEDLSSFADTYVISLIILLLLVSVTYLRILKRLLAYQDLPPPERPRTPVKNLVRLLGSASICALMLILLQGLPPLSLVVVVLGLMIPVLALTSETGAFALTRSAISMAYVRGPFRSKLRVFNQLLITVSLLFLLSKSWRCLVTKLLLAIPSSTNLVQPLVVSIGISALADLVWLPCALLLAASTTLIFSDSYSQRQPAPASLPIDHAAQESAQRPAEP